jgi:hypothetical protein
MRHLLCTFAHRSETPIILDVIKSTYELDSKMLFIFSDVDSPEKYIFTYNVNGQYDLTSNTILVHRKSETNTLYSLNALNVLIGKLNNGKPNRDYVIDWAPYSNSLVLLSNGELSRTRLRLEKVIKNLEIYE